jgi:methylmalonyl-CoA/ethylmalonyl-CoA epimerase
MKLRRIDHVGIVVRGLADPAELLGALGLELARANRNDESTGHYFPCGDASIELIEVHDDEARARRLPEGVDAVIEHIAIEVDDLSKMLEALRGLGVSTDAPPMRVGTRLNVWTVADTSEGVQYQFLQEDAATPPAT